MAVTLPAMLTCQTNKNELGKEKRQGEYPTSTLFLLAGGSLVLGLSNSLFTKPCIGER